VATPTATSLTITWTVSGDIERFEVTYSYTVKRCSATGGSVTANIADGSVRSYPLNDLNEDSRYTITVRAIYSGGSTMATVMGDTMTAGKVTCQGFFTRGWILYEQLSGYVRAYCTSIASCWNIV
jgi:hypothetical protein